MQQRGFTLIEVLVAIVILAVGLVGIAGLQAQSLRNSQDSYFRTQANAFATDLADRMRANSRGATNPSLPYRISGVAGLSSTQSSCNPCNEDDIARNDLIALKQKITASNMPNGDAIISAVTVDGSDVLYRINIQWDTRREGNPGNTCGEGGLICYSTTVRINGEG